VRILSVASGCVSVFFVFYTVRLLIVTGFLQHTRAGGNGAFVGAVVFPLLAIGFAWASRRWWKRGGGRTPAP
jgi:hypothetical protein